MTTKVKNETTRKSRGSRVKSVKVSANELQTVVNSVSVSSPSGSGLSDGVSGVSVTSDPVCVGADGENINKVSGHNNATSQIDTLIKVEETEETAKEERLYNKVVSHFLAPVFDADKRKAEILTGHVLAGGKITPAIIAKVDEMVSMEKKAFAENNPAPLCTVALVLDVIRKHYDNEFKSVVGVSATGIKENDIKTYSRSLGVLLSVSIPDNATPQLIVRSVLSYKYLLLDRAAQAKLRCHDNGNYYDGLRMAVRAGIELGRDDETIINDVKYYLSQMRESDSRELTKLRDNFYRVRAKLDTISKEINSLCPAIVDVVGSSYIVRLDRVKSVKVSAKVKTEYLTRYRSAVADLTRINCALFGLTSF